MVGKLLLWSLCVAIVVVVFSGDLVSVREKKETEEKFYGL
jgi:hypothetical protein